ncbi:MAG TPA: sterol desaturase family protein [Myxococcota bacterium]|nr:sterol desaturase family protein [Myxococcota bacterium]
MDFSAFLASLSVIVPMLALATLLELALPMLQRPRAQRRRVATNLGITALTLAWNGALTWAAAGVALALSLQGPGLMTQLGIPRVVQIAGGFIVLDFSFGYLAHRLLHAWPMLWRVHRVHHSDPFVDATTTFRNHPLEGLWRFLFLLVPTWLLGVPTEAVALQRLLTGINGVLEHANIRLWPPLDRALSLIWVTPAMHKVHHSRDPIETDSNYGNILSVYDRAFRSFTSVDRTRSVTYGLGDVDPRQADSLPKLLALPFLSRAEAGPVRSGQAA